MSGSAARRSPRPGASSEIASNILVLPAPLSPCSATSPGPARSEEHTSELQSLMRISYAVFCLKKKRLQSITTHTHHRPLEPNHFLQTHSTNHTQTPHISHTQYNN